VRIDRASAYVRRWTRAVQLGVPLNVVKLGRMSDFVDAAPGRIAFRGKQIDLRMPDEIGVRHALIEVLFEDGYDLRKIRRQIDTVADIGASTGFFALAIAIRFPSAHVHCYEPNPDLRPYIEHNLEGLGARVFSEAVMRDEGFVNLEIEQESVAAKASAHPDGTITATAFRTVVERLGNRVDLVKMDCEGSEWEILQDAAPWSHVRSLALEYHCTAKYGPDDAERMVTDLGFTIAKSKPAAYNTGIILAQKL
jgi:FkbM family methyltransferase